MTNTPINLKQERDFGGIFNATFGFIFQEFKGLATSILYFVLPLLILSAISLTFYGAKAQELQNSLLQSGINSPLAVFSLYGTILPAIFAALFLSILATNMVSCTVIGYIKLYVQRGANNFSTTDVWLQVVRFFFPILGASILCGLLIMVGFMFCIFPSIYLAISLSFVFSIMIIEEKSFSDSFSRSFALTKTDFWLILGVVVVAYILVMILTVITSIPTVLLGFKSLFSSLKGNPESIPSFSTGYYIANSINQLFSQIFMIIFLVISTVLYYSFVEKIEKPSLFSKIDQVNENA